MELANKNAIITGSTGDLGSVIVTKFLDEGANLALPYHSEQKYGKLASRLPESVFGAQVDVTEEQQVQSFFQQVKERFGTIDILVNTVGGFAGGKPTYETDLSTWEKMMTLNLKSSFLCSRAALQYMIKQGFGKIVNISASVALESKPNRVAYAVSKAAIIKLTESIAVEGKAHNIQANVIVPSIILTDANKQDMPDADFSKWATPEQIADTIVFLSSASADAITGSVIRLQGKV